MTATVYAPVPHDIDRAVETLRRGGLVAFPTETVYGLGGDASNPSAVARIFAAKGRPPDHPVIVHLGDVAALPAWADRIPEAAWALADRFWPGPLTLVLPRAGGVSDLVTGGQETVGLRMPAHPATLALLREFGGGLGGPSANRFGRVSPTTAAHVLAELGDVLDGVLDGGPCRVGIESTILDLSVDHPRILRPGAITGELLKTVLGEVPPIAQATDVRVPGALASHYAPRVPVHLSPADEVDERAAALAGDGRPIAVMARRAARCPIPGCLWQEMPQDPEGYAQALYATLRALDTPDRAAILVERVPAGPAWRAVADRLGRAAHRDA
jgi:L-threonylcarbamoyladenylate synthase